VSFIAHFVDSGENYRKRDESSDNHERQKTKTEKAQHPKFFAISLPFRTLDRELRFKRAHPFIVSSVLVLGHHRRIAPSFRKRNGIPIFAFCSLVPSIIPFLFSPTKRLTERLVTQSGGISRAPNKVMHATFFQKVILCALAGFAAACLIQWGKVFVEGADKALNGGYEHRASDPLAPHK